MNLSRRSSRSLLLAAVLAVTVVVSSVVAQTGGGGIQEAMTPEQFKAAGLNKLSPSEIQNLNKWLSGYRETTVKTAKKTAERAAAEVTVSRVDGIFNGIAGGTVVRLEDGTVWKQANSDEHWRAPGLDHPPAAVYKTAFGRKMRI